MVKVLLIFILVAILMEDGSSIRKTAEEVKEDEEVAKAVNRTLAEEEKKKEEEERKKRDEKKKTTDKVTDNKEKRTDTEKQVGQDEDCPACNFTCPEVEMCRPCEKCEDSVSCPDPVECPKGKDCPQCPSCKPCDPCGPCPPVKPCPGTNSTLTPPNPGCQESSGMSTPVAMAGGAVASLMITGAVAAFGLLLRYAPPFVSGSLFLISVALTWYLSSRYPETARELGGQAWAALQEATLALGHRVMEAIQRHHEQVGFSCF
jgi:hypothetical protein